MKHGQGNKDISLYHIINIITMRDTKKNSKIVEKTSIPKKKFIKISQLLIIDN